ncbi:MAG: radical SAM protein [candidate division Zixibacteria bacterium]|nr:radical SAM protein [candidate division Zixibacteria bacterium]MDH4034786.1 radical SAM protein [candidate division Zixibacteria bacterium]
MAIGDFATKTLLPIYQSAVSRVHDLRYLFVELTHRCDLACLHCGSDCIRDTRTPDLPSQEVIRVLEEIKQKYDSHKIMVALAGGEPLCYPSLFTLGAEITQLEFPWGMVTNGHAWTKETVAAAKAAGMCSVTVSLDGFEEDHNWLRGRSDSYARAVRTIQMLVADPFYQCMDIVTCVNKRSLERLDEFYEQVRELGVPAWRLFTISPIGRAVRHDELFLNGDEFRSLMGKIERYRRLGDLPVTYSESGYLGPRHELKARDHRFFCQAGISVAGVMVNGDILACPNIDRRFSQGNIFKDSFVDIWENRYQAFRNRKWMKTDKCVDCSEWSRCRGNSFHLWDLDNDRTRLCYHELLKTPTQ